ncbi:MAG: Rab family GTPase [Planctomycetota bacterium]
MQARKICMLGAFAVGKTSLVSRFVRGIYSEKYLSTIGIKIDRKPVDLGRSAVELILWDLAGEDDFVSVQTRYLRGSAGYLLVADGTRPDTLETALILRRRVVAELGELPFVLVLNKADLTDRWQLGRHDEQNYLGLRDLALGTLLTSAKTGDAVEAAFNLLARETTA